MERMLTSHFSHTATRSPRRRGRAASALPPAGSHQLCLAHSLDHLVGAGEKGGSYLNSDGLSCLGVDDQFEPCRLLNRKVSRLRTSKNTIKVYKHVLVHF